MTQRRLSNSIVLVDPWKRAAIAHNAIVPAEAKRLSRPVQIIVAARAINDPALAGAALSTARMAVSGRSRTGHVHCSVDGGIG